MKVMVAVKTVTDSNVMSGSNQTSVDCPMVGLWAISILKGCAGKFLASHQYPEASPR